MNGRPGWVSPGATRSLPDVDLNAADWMTLTDLTVSDNGNERTVTDLSPGESARFCRVEISSP